jgi:hypothetical protein
LRNAYKIVVGKPEGKIPLRRYVDVIRMYLRKIGWEDVGGMHLAQDGDQWWVVTNTIMNLPVPEKIGIFLDC